MLCYLGTGRRYYRERPVPVYRRPCWEFQAVLTGSIGLLLDEGPELLHSRRLWLCAPGFAHGWTGVARRASEVAVFHFLSVPESLKQWFKQARYLDIPLHPSNIKRLRELVQSLKDSWKTPHPEMILRHEHLLLELSILVCEGNPETMPRMGSSQRERIHTSLAWFNAHIARNPNLEEVSRASGTSPAHLRRLFHEVMQASPKKIFDQLRFRRALHLMADPGTKLSAVSEACGFESPSAFSRAFKNKFGCSPDRWRD